MPPIFVVEALGLTLAVTAVAHVEVGAGHAERIVLEAPTPIAVMVAEPDTLPSWHAEVSGFAERLAAAYELEPAEATRFSGWILEGAARQALPPELMAAVINIESEFRIEAQSAVGAVGPAQVVPRYWTDFCGGHNLELAEQNVYCGAQILAHYVDRCDGGYSCALEMYNVGPENARKASYAEARERYLAKVSQSLERFEDLEHLQLVL